LAHFGGSFKTGIRLITHLKIQIWMRIRVILTTTSIHDGTYLTAASQRKATIETLRRFKTIPTIVNMAAISDT